MSNLNYWVENLDELDLVVASIQKMATNHAGDPDPVQNLVGFESGLNIKVENQFKIKLFLQYLWTKVISDLSAYYYSAGA